MRRSQRIHAIAICAFAALAGCAANSPNVVPVGNDAYHVSVTGARYESQTDTNFRALSVANDFCNKKAEHLMFRQSTESHEYSWSPKQEDLIFVCMDAKDPAYMKASVERDPPTIAQQ
jgi:hypothetical protein